MAAFGILEEFEESVRHILSTLDLPLPLTIPHERNSASLNDPNLQHIEREPITPDVEMELERLTELDQQVYDYAFHRFRRLVAEKAQSTKVPAEISTTAIGPVHKKPPTLTELAARFKSDKGLNVGARPHRYTYLYDLLFWHYRQKRINLLDIGFTRDGDSSQRQSVSPSVQMWLAYFPRAHIFRFDVMDFSRFTTERFTGVQGDPGSEVDLRRLSRGGRRVRHCHR